MRSYVDGILTDLETGEPCISDDDVRWLLGNGIPLPTPGAVRIRDLPFNWSARVLWVLHQAKIIDIEQLRCASDQALLTLPNFGRKALHHVHEALGFANTVDKALPRAAYAVQQQANMIGWMHDEGRRNVQRYYARLRG